MRQNKRKETRQEKRDKTKGTSERIKKIGKD